MTNRVEISFRLCVGNSLWFLSISYWSLSEVSCVLKETPATQTEKFLKKALGPHELKIEYDLRAKTSHSFSFIERSTLSTQVSTSQFTLRLTLHSL